MPCPEYESPLRCRLFRGRRGGPAILAIHSVSRVRSGPVAQLGERVNRTHEARGSNPLGSTKFLDVCIATNEKTRPDSSDRCKRPSARRNRRWFAGAAAASALAVLIALNL